MPRNPDIDDPAPRRPRILVLNSGYLSTVPSGGDRHLLCLAGALGVEHTVDFVAPDIVRSLLPDTVRPLVYRSSLPRSLARLVTEYLARMIRAAIAAWRHDADIVLASPGLFDLVPAALHRWRHRSRSVVFVFHLGDPGVTRARSLAQRWLSHVAQSLAARLWRRASIVVTSTEEVADQLRATGVPTDRLLFQRPCVDVEAIRRTPAATDAPSALFIGRLVRRKGVFDLLDAAEGHGFSLGLVGDGEEQDALRREIARRDLDARVTLFGPVSDTRVWSLLRGARCLVLPSYEEGYSLVIAEALVAGVPVIAYTLPHYPEVFGDAITHVPRGDAAAFGREVDALLAGERSEAQARCRAARASVTIETAPSAAAQLIERLEGSTAEGTPDAIR